MNEIYTKLGELLELERERRQLTIESVSEQLKISESNLAHVEAGAVEETPSELYFGLFAKSYAEFLGIDYVATIDAIKIEIGYDLENGGSSDSTKGDGKAASGNKGDPGEKVGSTDGASGNGKKIFGWLFGIIIFFACFLAIWMLLIDPAPEPTVSDPSMSGDSSNQLNGDVETAAVTANSILEGFEFGDVPREAPAPIRFKMVASQESWANVIADGELVISRNLIEWREYEVEAKYRLQVSIAHPSRVQTHLNGQLIDLRDPDTRRISRRLITQINLAEFLAQASSPAGGLPEPKPVTPPAQTEAAAGQTEADLPDSLSTDESSTDESQGNR